MNQLEQAANLIGKKVIYARGLYTFIVAPYDNAPGVTFDGTLLAGFLLNYDSGAVPTDIRYINPYSRSWVLNLEQVAAIIKENQSAPVDTTYTYTEELKKIVLSTLTPVSYTGPRLYNELTWEKIQVNPLGFLFLQADASTNCSASTHTQLFDRWAFSITNKNKKFKEFYDKIKPLTIELTSSHIKFKFPTPTTAPAATPLSSAYKTETNKLTVFPFGSHIGGTNGDCGFIGVQNLSTSDFNKKFKESYPDEYKLGIVMFLTHIEFLLANGSYIVFSGKNCWEHNMQWLLADIAKSTGCFKPVNNAKYRDNFAEGEFESSKRGQYMGVITHAGLKKYYKSIKFKKLKLVW